MRVAGESPAGDNAVSYQTHLKMLQTFAHHQMHWLSSFLRLLQAENYHPSHLPAKQKATNAACIQYSVVRQSCRTGVGMDGAGGGK